MRSLIFTLLSLFVIAFASPANAESRYCAGSCDRYGDPVYHVPPSFDGRPTLRNDYLYPPGYRPAPRYREHRRIRRVAHHRRYVGHRRYERRSYRTKRRYKRRIRRHRGYRHHHQHRRYARPTFHNRTKYCRDEVEWTGHGHGIRRCVWVRNDLIYRYEGRGYRRH